MKTLLWKEWREHRPTVLLAFAVPVAGAALASAAAEPLGWGRSRPVFVAVLWSWTLMPLIIGAALVAGERAGQTLAFQQALPLRAFRLWLAKVLFGTVIVAILAAAYTSLILTQAEGEGYGPKAWLAVPIGWLLFMMAFSFSCCAATPMLALLLGIFGSVIFWVCASAVAIAEYEVAWMLLLFGVSTGVCSYALLRGSLSRAGQLSSHGDVRALGPLALCIAIPLLVVLVRYVDWLHLDPDDVYQVDSIAASNDGNMLAGIGYSELKSPWTRGSEGRDIARPCIVVWRLQDETSACFPLPVLLLGSPSLEWPFGTMARPWSPQSDYLAYAVSADLKADRGLAFLDVGRGTHQRLTDLDGKELFDVGWLDKDHIHFSERHDHGWTLGVCNVKSGKVHAMSTAGRDPQWLGFERTGGRCFFVSSSPTQPGTPRTRRLWAYDVRERATTSMDLPLLADRYRLSPDGRWLLGIGTSEKGNQCYHTYSLCDLTNGEVHPVWQSTPAWSDRYARAVFSESSRWLLIWDWRQRGDERLTVAPVAIEVAARRVCDPFAGRDPVLAMAPRGDRIAGIDRQRKRLIIRDMSQDSPAGWELDLGGTEGWVLQWVNERQLVLRTRTPPVVPRRRFVRVRLMRQPVLWLVDLEQKSVKEIWPRRRALPELRVVEVGPQP